MVLHAGVDGCPAGWVVVCDGDAVVCPDFATVLRDVPADAVIAVDIPIGLEDEYRRGGRVCDRMARALLGRFRGTSVFPAPPRPALGACDLPEARSLGWPATLEGLNILGKIRDVDTLMTPKLQRRVFEVHPELSFHELNGGHPVLASKRGAAGRTERRRLLDEAVGSLPPRPRAGEAEDDLLDACAAAWSASRIARHTGERLPRDPPRDARGLRMEIYR